MERELRLKVSLRAQERYVTQLIHAWHNATICVTWPIYACGMTHDSHTCVARVIFAWYAAFTCVTWDFHVCHDMHTRDSFQRITWRSHMCDMMRSHVWHDSFQRTLVRTTPCERRVVWGRQQKWNQYCYWKKKPARNITRSTPWAGPRCSWVYNYTSVYTYIHRYI